MDKQTKDQQGNALTIKSGPQAGQATQKFFCAMAFRKDDPAFPAFYQLMVAEARKGFPHLFDAAGNCLNPRFSWKLVDGDSTIPDEGGRAPCTKEGFPGHWVVRFQSSFAPRCFHQGHYAPQEQIQDMNLIRRGYYGRVSGTIEANGNTQKPGLYVNLSMFELSGQGVEIVSGPDAAAVFGGTPVGALPPGATALPGVAPVGAMPGMPAPAAALPAAMPGMQPAMQMPGMPAQPAAAPGLPAAMPGMTPVAPNPGILAGPAPAGAMPMPGMPAPPAAVPMPPAAPAEPVKTATWPAGFTYAQMTGNGWTDALLRQNGYIV